MTAAIEILTTKRHELMDQDAELKARLYDATKRRTEVTAAISDIDAAIAKLEGKPPELPTGLPPEKCRRIVQNAVAAGRDEPGKKRGSRGGKARAAKLTPAERSRIASEGAKKRWAAARAGRGE